ncbi:hypothetical protein E6H25_01355 [Candidatus Bathyarchaeota archaeon]|nr:MAG: hypothetical protein E6H25_01355 [Candidatus Bathyarchaeota archaeon]
MTRSLFTAGLNWKVIEKKWPSFQKAFADFSISKPSRSTLTSSERMRSACWRLCKNGFSMSDHRLLEPSYGLQGAS